MNNFTQMGGIDREKRRHIIVYVCTVVFAAMYVLVGGRIASEGMPVVAKYGSQMVVQAKVVSLTDQISDSYEISGEKLEMVKTLFRAIVSEGEFKGTEITALHLDDPFSPYHLRPVQTGDNVFLQYAPEDHEEANWVLQEYRRTDGLILIGVVVIALILIFGKLKGIHTIISLIFTCLSIFAVFIPSILSGKNIYLSSIITGGSIIAVTILLVSGPNKKSFCAGIGCVFGFLSSGIMSLIMDRILGLTGLVDEDSVYLLYLNADNPIDLNAVIFAAVTVGALGAVMDTAISIASSLNEVYQADPWIEPKEMLRSGVNIGRDTIGTMSSTLLLAYIGSSLSLVVLLAAYNDSLMILLNKEMIVVEIMQALVGVAGLLLVIPLTSLICSVVYTKQPSNRFR